MAISASALWETYVQHFSFTQLGWIFETFNSKAEEDCLTCAEDILPIISDWLQHHWGRVDKGGSFKSVEANRELLESAMTGKPLPLSFVAFIDVLHCYEALHIDTEENAGFPPESVSVLQKIFDNHSAGAVCGGLKGKALFAVLADLDIEFHSKEERQWYVETVKRLDKNGDGSINFRELCQIIRVVVDMELVKKRQREFNLVKLSKLPFDEVEDWNVLFQEKDEDGQGELQLVQVKELISSIGMKWDKDFSETVKQWMLEADENNNGTIDFGEFCVLIGKLWSSNFHDIRGATRKLMKKDIVVSLKSAHDKFVSTNPEGQLSAVNAKAGARETFTMISLPSGCVRFQGPNLKFIKCVETTLGCTADDPKNGTEFKMTTWEDERVVLVASNAFGGTLYATKDGSVALSDGNPADEPNQPFSLVKQEELAKKCWSRLLKVRKPSKLVVERRKQSIDKGSSMPEGGEPLSPGIQEHIEELEKALEENKRMTSKLTS